PESTRLQLDFEVVRFDPRGSDTFASAAHLAALHLYFLARWIVAPAYQHADALDVRPRTGIGLGETPLSELFFSMWSRRGAHRGDRQNRTCLVRGAAFFDAHHCRFWSDFREHNSQRGALPRLPHLAVSPACSNPEAPIRCWHG